MKNTYYFSSPAIHEARIWSFKYNYNIITSYQFLDCAENQLKRFFTKITGIQLPNNNIATSAELDTLQYGEVSSFQSSLFINHQYLFTKICWNSKSGRIYKMGDEDIDCDDIQFWQEGIDAKLVHQYLHPTFNNPFKLKEKDLTYELVISNLAIDMDIDLTLKEPLSKPTQEIINNINSFIEKYNAKADKSDGEIGAVHNWKVEGKSDGFIYHFDLGLSGMTFLPGLLKYLSKMNCFSKVELQ